MIYSTQILGFKNGKVEHIPELQFLNGNNDDSLVNLRVLHGFALNG
jgi:hypothetical protein